MALVFFYRVLLSCVIKLLYLTACFLSINKINSTIICSTSNVRRVNVPFLVSVGDAHGWPPTPLRIRLAPAVIDKPIWHHCRGKYERNAFRVVCTTELPCYPFVSLFWFNSLQNVILFRSIVEKKALVKKFYFEDLFLNKCQMLLVIKILKYNNYATITK